MRSEEEIREKHEFLKSLGCGLNPYQKGFIYALEYVLNKNSGEL
jgi:hypothetical protein